MTNAHTPGPWRVFTTPDGRRVIGVGDRTGGGITDQGDVSTNDQGVWRSGKEKLANARLIAAAPDLLEALKDCLAALTDPVVGTIYGDDPDWYRKVNDAADKAAAAVAKATSTEQGERG